MTVRIHRLTAEDARRAAGGDNFVGVIAERQCLAARQPEAESTLVLDRLGQRLTLLVGLDCFFEHQHEAVELLVVGEPDRSDDEVRVARRSELERLRQRAVVRARQIAQQPTQPTRATSPKRSPSWRPR